MKQQKPKQTKTFENLDGEELFLNAEYLQLVLPEIPRLLGLIDKNSLSSTYGCCDRDFWKYKTKDFTNARLQESAYTLALLYSYDTSSFEELKNPYYKNEQFKELSFAICLYWARLQHKNGSYDEYYFNEKSHVATVFSSLAIVETYKLLGFQNKRILSALKKSAEWISKHDDLDVINHDAGSVLFYQSLFEITHNKRYETFLQKKLLKVQRNQHKEGWFKEYGGADIGYQTYTIYFLAKYYRKTKNAIVKKMLTNAIHFFSYFISPDGTIGGLLGSRDTNFIIPTGFELLRDDIKLASEIADELQKLYSLKKLVGPYSFDNRFLLQELYVYLDFKNSPRKKQQEIKQNSKIYHVSTFQLPKDAITIKKYFRCAGFYILKKSINTNSYYLIINLKKSGIGSYSKNTIALNTLVPYGFVKQKNKKTIYMTYGPSIYSFVRNKQENKLIIRSHFFKYISHEQSTIKLIGVKLLALIGIASFLKKIIRQLLIKQIHKTSYVFKRTINLNTCQVEDYVDLRLEKSKQKFFKTSYSPIYSTSVGFVSESESKKNINF